MTRNTSAIAAILAGAALSQNILLIASPGKSGEGIAIGDDHFILTNRPDMAADDLSLVDVSCFSDASVATLGFSAQPGEDETVTIGAITYVWKNQAKTFTVGARIEIQIGETLSESMSYLVAAIRASHPDVRAVQAASSIMIFAKEKGSDGNLIAIGEAMENAAWGAETMVGGKDADPAAVITALVDAINLRLPKGRATAIEGGLLFVDSTGRGPIDTRDNLFGDGNGWILPSTFGIDPGLLIPSLTSLTQRAVTEAEEDAQVFVLALPGAPTAFTVQVRNPAGGLKHWDGRSVVTGNAVLLYSDGLEDLEENDVVAVTFSL